jgi:hypothetical protein
VRGLKAACKCPTRTKQTMLTYQPDETHRQIGLAYVEKQRRIAEQKMNLGRYRGFQRRPQALNTSAQNQMSYLHDKTASQRKRRLTRLTRSKAKLHPRQMRNEVGVPWTDGSKCIYWRGCMRASYSRRFRDIARALSLNKRRYPFSCGQLYRVRAPGKSVFPEEHQHLRFLFTCK